MEFFEDIPGWIEDHPIVTAVLIFVGMFIVYQVVKKNSTQSTALPGTPAPSPTYYDYSQSTTNVTNNPPAPAPKPTPAPAPGPPPTPTPTPGPHQPPPPPKPTSQYVTVQPWPAQLSTLWGISQYAHKTLAQIEALNPQYSSNWNLIYAGQKVRIA